MLIFVNDLWIKCFHDCVVLFFVASLIVLFYHIMSPKPRHLVHYHTSKTKAANSHNWDWKLTMFGMFRSIDCLNKCRWIFCCSSNRLTVSALVTFYYREQTLWSSWTIIFVQKSANTQAFVVWWRCRHVFIVWIGLKVQSVWAQSMTQCYAVMPSNYQPCPHPWSHL